MERLGQQVLAHARIAGEQHVDRRIDRRAEHLDHLLHRLRLADHQVGIERQVLLPRMAGQDRLVPADVVHQAEHQQVAQGAEREDRRPLLGREAREGGDQRVAAVERDEGVMEDPGRRLAQHAEERALLRDAPRAARAPLPLALLQDLAEQRLAARQPRRIGGHHQLERGPLQLPHQQEHGAAAEVRQHLVDQRLRGGPALGVAEHPLAHAVQMADHPDRRDHRRPIHPLLLDRRAAAPSPAPGRRPRPAASRRPAGSRPAPRARPPAPCGRSPAAPCASRGPRSAATCRRT